MSKNIILIGFMGVGKGTIARALIKKTGLYGIDCDDLIESLENRKVKTIFEIEGEEFFRDLEKKTAKWLERNVSNTIISTGGGFYKVKNLNKIGKVIYLESSFKGIMDRIKSSTNSDRKLAKRPLLNDMKKAKKLFDERIPSYKDIADITVNVENKSSEKIVKEILKQLR